MSSSSKPPRLRHIANLWSMVHYPSKKEEWSLERKVAEIKASGFDGFTTFPTSEHKQLAEKHGLTIIGYFATGMDGTLEELIGQNKEAGAHYINVQLADEDTLPLEALDLTLRMMKEGARQGVELAVEIHRDTATETPEKLYALTDAYEKATGELLSLTLDYSHIAVVKHLQPRDYVGKLLVHPPLIQGTAQMHLRPFNGHHAQVPVTDGHGGISPETEDWLPFVEELFRIWLSGPQSGRDLFVCPEMGPIEGGYNLHCLPNSWEDAVVLKKLIQKCWEAAAPSP
jgi:sugar phosphate isomerase/epimerase